MPLEKKTRAIIAAASSAWALSLVVSIIALAVIVAHNWHLISVASSASYNSNHIKHDLPFKALERLSERLTKVYNAVNTTCLKKTF